MTGARSYWSWWRRLAISSPGIVPRALARWIALVTTLAVVSAILLTAGPAAASRDLKWKTIETEHFYVHYYAGQEEGAARATMFLERAYDRLTVDYGHAPFLKTHVRMVDNTDSANGSATVVPFPRINGFITAPDSMSVLESFDDWLDVLMTHELVHIVHLDTIHGLPRLVNALVGFGVLGKVWMPNIIQPRWIVEGLATYEESHLTSQGRRRSAQFDGMLRMHVLEQGFLPIDRVSSGANVFPHGSAVYLYGLHLIHYIASRYGRDKLRELSHVFGGQTIPYGINRALKKVIGVDFYQLWDEFELDTTRRFQAQARQIRGRGIREGRRLTFSVGDSASAQFTRHPFWSPDDRQIYFYADDGNDNPGIRRIDARGGRLREGLGIGREGMNVDVEHLIDIQQAASGSFIAGTPDMVFELRRIHDFRYSWNDLYRWRAPNPNAVERLTFGLRARDPHVSPDGRTVVFSRNDSAQSRLAFLDLGSLEVVEVPPLDRIAQVLSPRWAPDNQRVAFSGFREGGYRDIFIYDRETQALTPVTQDRFLNTEPSWTPDGRFVLFASDRDGVMNIYAYEVATATTWQVTNVLGGAYEPVPSHDGSRLAYIGASATGYDLWVMKLDPEAFFEPLPVVDALPPIDDPTPELDLAAGRHLAFKSKRYQPIRTMFPRTLMPSMFSYENTGIGPYFAANAVISDVLGIHTLAGEGGYFFDYGAPTGGVTYRYNQLLPSFVVSFGRGFAVRNGFDRFDYDHAGEGSSYRMNSYRERITQARAGVGVPVLRHPIHSAEASANYRFIRYHNLDEAAIDPNAPTSTLPLVGDVGQVDLGLSYANVRSPRHAYGGTTGRRASISVTVIDPHLGGDFSDLQVRAAYTEYLRMPWRGRQVLAMRLGAGASAGGFGRRPAFFLGGLQDPGDLVRELIAVDGFSDLGVLQGYAPGALSGTYFGILNLQYRAPIVDIERGLGTVPLFFRRLTFAPFADIGGAWSGALSREVIKVGAGASMIFSFRLGYGLGLNMFLTYAHGFDDELGVDTFRAALGRSF